MHSPDTRPALPALTPPRAACLASQPNGPVLRWPLPELTEHLVQALQQAHPKPMTGAQLADVLCVPTWVAGCGLVFAQDNGRVQRANGECAHSSLIHGHWCLTAETVAA